MPTVCVLFLVKLRWPKKKNFCDIVTSFHEANLTTRFIVDVFVENEKARKAGISDFESELKYTESA